MSLPFLNTAPGYDEELRNSVFFERGLHATSICGAVRAAVAVAMLQGQDEAGIASAAVIAVSMGAGLLEANGTGGTVKRVHCGWAANCCVAAADLAPARAHRPADRAGGPLRVPAGVLRRPRPPGRRRPRPGHGLGAAARGLQAVPVQPLHPRRRGRRPAAARPGARPRRRHSDRAGRRQARPAHDRRATRGQGTAGLGVPRGVQRPLHGRRGAARRPLGVSHEDFTDAAARDPRRLALAALVRCVEDERCSASFPHAFQPSCA